jgi:uncharacterized Zn finger protein
MSPHESVEAKSHRYLAEGRLTIELVSQGRVVANCRGNRGDTYAIDYDPRRRKWSCSCPSRRRCCHVTAARLVTRQEGAP